MTHTSDFVAFAVGDGANVKSAADWSVDTSRALGFQAGTASSTKVNTALRQSTSIAAMVAKFTADYGTGNVLDNGDISTLETQFAAALAGWALTGVTGRFLRVSVYTNVGGTQYVSINGAAPTTTGATSFTSQAATAFHIVEAIGGGGAGGGAPATAAGYWSMGHAGNPGAQGTAYIPGTLSSIAVTVPAAPAGVSGGTGGSGGSTTFGSLFTAPGGGGGSTASTPSATPIGGLVGTISTTCTVSGVAKLLKNNYGGGPSFLGLIFGASNLNSQPVGSGGSGQNNAYAQNVCVGGGSGGQVNGPSASAQTGYAGSPGMLTVYEYA